VHFCKGRLVTVETASAPFERPTSDATTLRAGQPDDAEQAGRICFEAFRALATVHNFPPDFPSAEVAAGVLADLLAHPGFYSVVAEQHGRIVGTNFLDERSTIAGVGPVTVDPGVQDSGVGTLLMLDVIERARAKSFPGTRLLQARTTTARSACTRSSASTCRKLSSPFRARLSERRFLASASAQHARTIWTR
jgi:predicted N-acetyltransferase YhbS